MNNIYKFIRSIGLNHLTRKVNKNLTVSVMTLLSCCAMVGCGGGGGSSKAASPATNALSGTAAIGTALASATVTAHCSSGTTSTVTNANGSYSLLLSGLTLPCILQATSDGTNYYYSAAYTGQTTANITPLTQVILANALGATTDPATAFASAISAVANKLTSANIATATANITAALVQMGVPIPNGTNPITGQFTASTTQTTGDAMDASIDAFMSALKNANTSLTTLSTGLASTATAAAAASYLSTTGLVYQSSPALMTFATTSYSLQSFPLFSGLVSFTNTQIIYAIDVDPTTSRRSYVYLRGTFSDPGASSALAANLAGVSGTITTIIHADENLNPIATITNLNINEATFESIIENQKDLYYLWQLISQSNGGLQIAGVGKGITCPTPVVTSNAQTASTTTTVSNQNIKTFFANSCVP